MWHLTACKISFSLSFQQDQKWNEYFYISELMLATLIQRHNKKSFRFELSSKMRLTEILQAVRRHVNDCINTMYNFVKAFLDNEMSIFEEFGAFNKLINDKSHSLL